ncbi:mandelate racemase/muconate lactonizing enzyme family protein [Thermomicrobium sp. CFH 73360]|uniref:mandelate racemase/muconate lactonizing enzyme family protein n=1 Tax=Thermomicrobium sp. CFH 73360 TaxID=2951987 RepID=UPI002076FD80|nr:mandelate racemase/muconate lactonizing enzyme family protein [Thermomicrobium sp. CFH 73360]MCM8745888.1 mandelate racemase/muconate lactonizing enzyme family protein [Thermomicrobium sp. CFH 73360]
MRITDLRCAVLGGYPIVRIMTDEGIDGYGQIESTKSSVRWHVLFYREHLLGEDPTDVARVMRKIRRLGAFKPWGSAVSAIEMALWDITGKAYGVPVYKLLGGKLRDRVRVYNGGVRQPLRGYQPEDFVEHVRFMKQAPEGFSIVKVSVGYHGPMFDALSGARYGDPVRGATPYLSRGPLTERGLRHLVTCVEAMKAELGEEIGLALDCGPGWTVPDAIRFARAVEHLNLLWLEDLITGDYTPYVLADVYREVTQQTTVPIHTGEQIYLRENFVELIERHAVRIIGPDPADVGGLAELKWVAEYADLHGLLIAPHGIYDGLIGLAALVHVCATLPDNFIAFEYPVARPEWWYDIVVGLPNPIVVDGHIAVWDRPGLGVRFDVERARQYLAEEDRGFFDE